MLIDFNPFGCVTDGLLFGWDELMKLPKNPPNTSAAAEHISLTTSAAAEGTGTETESSGGVEFRIISRQGDAHLAPSQYMNSRLPKDVRISFSQCCLCFCQHTCSCVAFYCFAATTATRLHAVCCSRKHQQYTNVHLRATACASTKSTQRPSALTAATLLGLIWLICDVQAVELNNVDDIETLATMLV